jgi:hypothetical protein
VFNFHLVIISALIALPVPITTSVEKAFLQNSPEALRELLTSEGTVPLSLPDPLSLADHLSPDQTYLVFKRIFSVFKTTEFNAEAGLSSLPGQAGGILKARWSFRNERTGNSYPFRVYFYVVPVPLPSPGTGRETGFVFRIVEIRAERL